MGIYSDAVFGVFCDFGKQVAFTTTSDDIIVVSPMGWDGSLLVPVNTTNLYSVWWTSVSFCGLGVNVPLNKRRSRFGCVAYQSNELQVSCTGDNFIVVHVSEEVGVALLGLVLDWRASRVSLLLSCLATGQTKALGLIVDGRIRFYDLSKTTILAYDEVKNRCYLVDVTCGVCRELAMPDQWCGLFNLCCLDGIVFGVILIDHAMKYVRIDCDGLVEVMGDSCEGMPAIVNNKLYLCDFIDSDSILVLKSFCGGSINVFDGVSGFSSGADCVVVVSDCGARVGCIQNENTVNWIDIDVLARGSWRLDSIRPVIVGK